MFTHYLQQQLEQRRELGLERALICAEPQGHKLLVDGKEYSNFAGNDYLGLATDIKASFNASAGATASPLVTGRQPLHCRLEQVLLDWVEAPESFGCLLFSSGFAANTGVISALFNNKDKDARLLQDKLNHASLMDAGKHVQALGHAKQLRFAHNDMASLERLLIERCPGNNKRLIVSEGVFSMDGDSADLNRIQDLKQQHQSWFMLDDAHGIGVNGDRGQGSFAAQGLSLTDSDIHLITFGKALGAQGAAVIAHRDVIDYLTNFCREYIYSTHLSPLQTQAVLHHVSLAQEQHWRRAKLAQNIAHFRDLAGALPFALSASQSPIQPVIIGSEEAAMSVAYGLKQQGIWAGAMRYPTVAKGQARLRVTITASHEPEDIQHLVNSLANVAGEQYVEC